MKRSWLLETGNVDGSIMEMALDYLRMLTHADLIKFNNLIKLFHDKEKSIYELIDTLGFIESSIAIASLEICLMHGVFQSLRMIVICSLK